MISIEDKKTSSRLVTINIIRVGLILILAALSITVEIFSKKPPIHTVHIFIALGTASLMAIFNFLLIRLRPRFSIYYQITADILLITALVYFSGGVQSPFYFLYILPIIVTSIFLSRKDTIYIAALSFILFGALSELMYLKLTPFFSWVVNEEVQRGTFIYNLVMSMIGFASIALISSYYFERIRRTGVELEQVQASFKDLDLLNSTVLEKMENGFLTCNSYGEVISFNEKSKSLLNIDKKSNIFQLLLWDSDFTKIEQITDSRKKHYFETEINNLLLGVSVSMLRKIYTFDRVFVFIITDLTEKREIEKQLKRKEHLALIGEMAAGMAHEIRNPLASISGSVQFLKTEIELTPEYRNLMNIIVKESNRLSKSIEDFLEYSKITPLEKSRFKLGELVDNIVELNSAGNKEINFIEKFSEKDQVYADMKQVEQLVWNLINNSIKAVNGAGTIEINIYEQKENLQLSIKDNGSGIDEDDLGNIFNPFYSKFTSGIGLGMPIVKRIVEEHNFEIKINSEKNIGTEVIICFKETAEY
ncbi:MAG: ATP-binding protein [Candidatus Aminicenantes bacterium]|nr:ATP-binding protein [Candidatus Aminicenantes bacterium]